MRPIFNLALASALMIATTAAVQAQDDGASTDQATEQTAGQSDGQTGGQTGGGPTLDLGQPVSTGPQLGERYSKQKFDDWDLACIKTEAESDPCSMLQILTGKDGNPMAEFSLFRLKEGGQAAAGATVIVPLETLLPAKLTIAVDGANGKQYNYTFCNPVGCIAQIGLTQEDVDAFKRGGKATLSLVPAPAPDQRITIDMSLKGFTAAYDVVDVVENGG